MPKWTKLRARQCSVCGSRKMYGRARDGLYEVECRQCGTTFSHPDRDTLLESLRVHTK